MKIYLFDGLKLLNTPNFPMLLCVHTFHYILQYRKVLNRTPLNFHTSLTFIQARLKIRSYLLFLFTIKPMI